MRYSATFFRECIDAFWLGRVTYADGLKIQQRMIEKVAQARKAEECNPRLHANLPTFSRGHNLCTVNKQKFMITDSYVKTCFFSTFFKDLNSPL